MILERPWGLLHYTDTGSGPPVVLLHPLAASGELWQPLIEQLTPGFRVIAPDARGHGLSKWDGTPFSVPDLAEDIAALITDLDAGPARVAGMSMGGCTALALAARRPDLVVRLALADTTADYGPEKGDTWGQRAAKAVSVPRREQLAFQVDRWFSPEFRAANPEEVKRISQIFVQTDSDAHAAACRALGSYEDTSRLHEINAPTLVVVGADDYATPPGMARTLVSGINGSTLKVIPAARHLTLVESEVAKALVVEHLQGGPAQHYEDAAIDL